MTPDTEKLVRYLVACGVFVDVYDDFQVRRTYAGRNQREEGAWSFALYGRFEGRYYVIIGSCSPLSDCVKAARDGRLSIYNREGSFDTEMIVENAPSGDTLPKMSDVLGRSAARSSGGAA